MSRLFARLLVLSVLTASLAGCADMGISNPFASSTTNANEVYFDQFEDIPIPRDMDVDRKRSFVSVTPEGTKMGLLTAEGRVDMVSLSGAMAHNMSQQGWAIRSRVSGPKMLEVFEKNNRMAVIYFYEQTTSTAMEIWTAIRLPDGFTVTTTPVEGGASSYGGGSTYGGSTSGGSSTGASGSVPLTQ